LSKEWLVLSTMEYVQTSGSSRKFFSGESRWTIVQLTARPINPVEYVHRVWPEAHSLKDGLVDSSRPKDDPSTWSSDPYNLPSNFSMRYLTVHRLKDEPSSLPRNLSF
ncbi:hypothetical protein HAX54_003028, partial [Datura stramonium]|nr:hypothetical protein [Datura stramonium]